MFSLIVGTIGSKLRLPGKGGEKGGDRVDGRLSRNSSGRYSGKFSGGDPDPGVISEDDDEFRVGKTVCFKGTVLFNFSVILSFFFQFSLMNCLTRVLEVH